MAGKLPTQEERRYAEVVLFGHKTVAWLRGKVSADRMDALKKAYPRLVQMEEAEKR
jgi:hypothetical protein